MIPALRDELWMVDLGMVQKPRLCLILSIASLDHERAVVSYVPRTTTLRGTRFEVPLRRGVWKPGLLMHRASDRYRR